MTEGRKKESTADECFLCRLESGSVQSLLGVAPHERSTQERVRKVEQIEERGAREGTE